MMQSQRSSSPSSAAVIGGNDDLLMQILLSLPAKSLIRFQLVSKHWHSLIFDPSFGQLHTLRHPKPQPSFILRPSESQFFICHTIVNSKLAPFRFSLRDIRDLKILQSVNGLLLLEGKDSQYAPNRYYIYNPTTMKSKELLLKEGFAAVHLVFDPLKSLHCQVVCVRKMENLTEYSVYDSETNIWNEGGDSSMAPIKFCQGVYCKDRFHSIAHRSMFRFILEDDLHWMLPQFVSNGVDNYITESDGHMYYVALSLVDPDKNWLRVMDFDKDGGVWSRKYLASLNPISATFDGKEGRRMALLGMVRGEILLFHVPGKIMLYRFSDKKFEVLIDFTREMYYEEGKLQFGSEDAYPFYETLVHV